MYDVPFLDPMRLAPERAPVEATPMPVLKVNQDGQNAEYRDAGQNSLLVHLEEDIRAAAPQREVGKRPLKSKRPRHQGQTSHLEAVPIGRLTIARQFTGGYVRYKSIPCPRHTWLYLLVTISRESAAEGAEITGSERTQLLFASYSCCRHSSNFALSAPGSSLRQYCLARPVPLRPSSC